MLELGEFRAGPCVATVKAARSDLHLKQPRLFGVLTRMGKVPTRAITHPGILRHAAAGGWIMLDARAGTRAVAAVAATFVVLVLAPASARSSGNAGSGARVDAA